MTRAAAALGVTRKHVSAMVNGRAPVTPDMALQLATAFTADPELWINIQAQFDLWAVRQKARPNRRRAGTGRYSTTGYATTTIACCGAG